MKYLGSKKMRHSGFPEDVVTPDEKARYCRKINEEMGFDHDALKLTPENVDFNTLQRNCTKLGLNSVLGKMSQDPNLASTLLLNTQDHLDKIMNDGTYEVKELIPVGEELLHVKVSRRKGFEKVNKKGNIVIGAYVTALARVEMYKAIRKCLDAKAVILYTDTGK